MAGRLVLLLALVVQCWGTVAAAAEPAYLFGVVPQFERRQLFAVWQPVLDEVAKRAGIGFEMTTALSVREFEQDLSNGRFDFVFTNPFHILQERRRSGYIPLVRGAAPLKGVLVVPADSPVSSPQELKGKVLAVPTPNALGASIMMQADLDRLFGVRVKLRDVNTHASVFLHVANRLVDAGGSVQKVLGEQKPEIRDRVRVIYTTRGMPSHPVAAHPRVPQEVRERVRRAFLDLATTPEGAAMLDKLPMNPISAAAMADYAVMEEWGLDKYWDVEGKLK
ncbi:phosphate/phosphite/phosphonate ABC transporter substrate-binding protein [Magnetospirillum sp. UT-4]|uniref:phosphate/phosphite/phosphonate ABC transporter substrate-binding protein n=1 Tax=Magnetospirillum sp. UT-4 TaxID=2681467 RepID=UPI001C2D00B9|nr:phosphate/phosphite/phosphonate ABC transporter substrate-binding protein [Magnetospirillum sp. UT-4]